MKVSARPGFRRLRVMVCETPDVEDFTPVWTELLGCIQRDAPDVVVLPEMPFSAWLCATPQFDLEGWQSAIRAHADWHRRLRDAPCAVIYSEPLDIEAGRRNVARLAGGGHDQLGHAKQLLPDEEGFWEARWYQPGVRGPEPFAIESCRIGVQVCTEMWSFEMSRRLGILNADLIAVPRTTPASSRHRWIAGGRAAAISAGAFCVSSNRAGPGLCDDFAGAGWIIDPDGEVIAVTSRNCPVVTCELNLEAARNAKDSYPRYALNQPAN